MPRDFVALDSTATLRGALATTVTLRDVEQPLLAVISEITRQARLSFIVDGALPAMSRLVRIRATATPAATALQRALAGSGLRGFVGPANELLILPVISRDSVRTPPVRLTGYVRSGASREVIRNAVLVVGELGLSRESNEEGYFVLTLPSGSHRLRVRAIGFTPLDTTVVLSASATRDFILQPQRTTLATVVVKSEQKDERADLDPKLPDMSVVRLDMATVRLAPPLLGEVDPLRSISLLPGVATVSDASTAFVVRGGGVDQNLILLDEAVIYNPSHILGFISTFNADAVDNVTLYKGAIPAKFGGRISSVVDVRQREGNANEYVGSASIGLISSRATFEGPLFGKRGSFLVAGRRSYADAFLRLSSDSTVNDATAYFYDLNAKGNVRLGQRGALMLSGYVGRDAFARPHLGVGVGWGNRAATLRWNQAIGDRLFSKVTATSSDYDFQFRFPFPGVDSARWKAGIVTSTLKVDETYQLTARHRLEFGGDWTAATFDPGAVRGTADSSASQAFSVEARRGRTLSAYAGHEFDAGPIAIRYGVRFATFTRVGQATRYRYLNDAPVVYNTALDRYEPGTVIDSARIARGATLVSYDGWEPRASARYSIGEQSSLKVSYSRTQQFMHLVSPLNSPTPLDLWEVAGPDIRPMTADQVAFGYSGQLGAYEFTAETFFKTIDDVVDFIDGAEIILRPRVETALVQGAGRAFGLELYARRTTGRLTGWASYTASRAEQRFPVPKNSGATSGGGVNDGNWYASPYDRLHNLSVVGAYGWKPKWTIGSSFLLASGLPTTLPQSRYTVDGFLVAEYGQRNAARLPIYHRLDVSLTRTLRRGELQFGVLNVYNRFNAQSLRVRQEKNNPLVAQAVQTSIFGVVPKINYVFRF
ncbi:MAG: TonB-dependent receptor [Gemmatimonadaceae bacterium]|nr:TonB-dependent receptor [Gemmatimonadaceae bacterium]